MTHTLNSAVNQQRRHLSYHEDGLLDLLVGLAVLLSGLYMLVAGDIPLGGLWVVLWLPLWLSARKSIAARHSPDVEVSQERYAAIMKAGVFVVVSLVLLVFAGLALLWGQSTGRVGEWFLAWLQVYLTMLLGLFLALVMAVASWLSGVARLFVYALLTAVVFVSGYILNVSAALPIALVGGFVMLWGLVLFARFVRSHPVQSA
jgi:hypothetical protein